MNPDKLNRLKKCRESQHSISKMTSSAILASTTKDFEDLKRARLNSSKNVAEPNTSEKGQGLEDFQKMAAAFQDKRLSSEGHHQHQNNKSLSNFPNQSSGNKGNQIWGNVINQQLLSEVAVGVVGLGVESSYGLGNRGPENYITRLMRKRKYNEKDGETESIDGSPPEVESDLSSDGLSDDSKSYWREKKKKPRKTVKKLSANDTSETSGAVAGPPQNVSGGNKPVGSKLLKEEFSTVGSQSLGVPANFKAFHFKKHYDASSPTVKTSSPNVNDKNLKNPKSYFWQKMEGMEQDQLGHFLANKLRERNRELIVRAVNLLGKEKCIKLYFKVLKIESGGGLLIKSKTRRRTKGGVFLYLVRNDKRLPQDKVELLFTEDKTRRIECMRNECDENQANRLRQQGMDELQIRLHKRMTTESVGMQEKREIEENNIICDIDQDDEFSFSVDKLVHHQPGYLPHEGPVGNRNSVVYDDVDPMEEENV